MYHTCKGIVPAIAQKLHTLVDHIFGPGHLNSNIHSVWVVLAYKALTLPEFLLPTCDQQRDTPELLGRLQALRVHIEAEDTVHAHALLQPRNGVDAKKPHSLHYSALVGAVPGKPRHVQCVDNGGKSTVCRGTDTRAERARKLHSMGPRAKQNMRRVRAIEAGSFRHACVPILHQRHALLRQLVERALRTHAAGVCDTECDPVALLEFPATMPRTIAAENVAADPFDDTDTFVPKDQRHRLLSLATDSVQITTTNCSNLHSNEQLALI
mmetsp:Transcript_1727/g.3547  ORF Transcript_1727/g.3547 Transcript_1727/m.3547 type:complete len:268 (-) Transcript_1727:211-1014(-)